MRNNEDYEFYDDWANRDTDEASISLEDYNDMRCAEEHGSDYHYDSDDDSNDPQY